MRIMDCVLIFFNKKLEPVKIDPEKPGYIKTSWNESLKVIITKIRKYDRNIKSLINLFNLVFNKFTISKHGIKL